MYAKILVPVDASATSRAGFDEAVRIARGCGATLRLMHVAEELPYMPEAVAYGAPPAVSHSEAVERGTALLRRLSLEAAIGCPDVETVLVEGDGREAWKTIEAQIGSSGADLVVIGTHGRRGLERLIAGSVAEQLARHARVPVLLVRAAEQDEPADEGLQSIAAAIA